MIKLKVVLLQRGVARVANSKSFHESEQLGSEFAEGRDKNKHKCLSSDRGRTASFPGDGKHCWHYKWATKWSKDMPNTWSHQWEGQQILQFSEDPK